MIKAIRKVVHEGEKPKAAFDFFTTEKNRAKRGNRG
jgi:hypothetical protein